VAEILKGLKPEKLWHHFEEISKIPRCSKHEEKVREYLISFAKEKGFEYKVDEVGNVVIIKKADPGFEDKPTIILQGHIDMVCEKNKDTQHDFEKEGVKLVVDGDWLRADGTTLGADNGVGVAAALAILEDENLKSGRIEALFTIDEETGLTGAFNLDPNMVSGKILLNLDSEEEGVIYIGCAGGRDTKFSLYITEEEPSFEMSFLKLKIEGLRGGHSGLNIHEGRGNAIKLMARALYYLRKSVNYNIYHFDGGDKHNAIPREVEVGIAVNGRIKDETKKMFEEFCELLKEEYKITEPNFSYSVVEDERSDFICDLTSTDEMVNFLMSLPHGVISMSAAVEGLVETSTNLAVAKLKDGMFEVLSSHRSSVASSIDWMGDYHRALGELIGAEIEQDKGYPGWTPNPDSEVLKVAKGVFERVLGKVDVKAIHAGLECGIIGEKCGGLDSISFGPDIFGAHSPEEKVGIKSTERFYECLRELIEELNK